ncbi:MAG: hypothetical protein GQ579_08615 [Bacteroidales bacterium]|nr:hypothetical protein [Bacteroidales bacterium]
MEDECNLNGEIAIRQVWLNEGKAQWQLKYNGRDSTEKLSFINNRPDCFQNLLKRKKCQKKMMWRMITISILALVMPISILAQRVGVFYDSTVKQIEFAAGDVKTALELKHFTVEMLDIGQLKVAYPDKKTFLIGMCTTNQFSKNLLALGGKELPNLIRQLGLKRRINSSHL